jgi:nitronate monooxygenase
MSIRLCDLLGVEYPIVQAPMAGVQGSALAIAVCEAGGLGSLPCALLSPAAMREELGRIAARTSKPYNVNFFCHEPPVPNAEREASWRVALAPYYREFGLDLNAIPAAAGRAPFSDAAADVSAVCRPAGTGADLGCEGAVLRHHR